MSAMTIRCAALSDAAEIARLTAQLGYAADAETIGGRLSRLAGRPDHLVVVAAGEAGLAGWMHAHASDALESGFRVEIVGLVVAEDCRRRGVGRDLVRRVEQWAAEIGAEALVVRSNTKRIESRGFYLALGYSESKTQSVYRKRMANGTNGRPE